jgi:hypothetical protein
MATAIAPRARPLRPGGTMAEVDAGTLSFFNN